MHLFAISIRTIWIFGCLVIGWTACADIIISEIMYNPDGTDTGKEWVEIYNNSAATVDLGGWRLADIQDSQYSTPFPTNTCLEPYQALVLVSDAAAFDAQWSSGLNRIELGNFPLLANTPSPTNEILAIRDSTTLIRDTVNYDDENGWPLISPDGSSIFALPSGLTVTGNDSGDAWRPSMPGVYGATYARSPLGDQDRASPGIVVAEPQARFTPSADIAWSMVVLPDIQNYVKTAANVPILEGMTTWIRDNRDAWNIQVVLQEGDIVNNNNTTDPTSGDQTSAQQWAHARNAMRLLDGEVPYIMATGNHDYGTTDAQNRSTFFNDYFKATDNPLVDSAHGGILQGTMEAGRLENAYYEFEAPDGREVLILSLEWGPRQEVVTWANRILARSTHQDKTAMVMTHAYMYHDETRYDWERNQDSDPDNNQGGNPHAYPTSNDTHDGQELWNELIRLHPNIEMVHSGHVGGDGVGYMEGIGAKGNTVYEMLFNTQFETYGGNGWLRVLEFLDDGRTVRVRTYSPFHDLMKDDPANAFVVEISPLRPADFDGDGDVDGNDFLIWQGGFPTNTGNVTWRDGDANGDGVVDAADLLAWQEGFGTGSAGAAMASVPESSSAQIAFAALALAAILRGCSRTPRTGKTNSQERLR